MPKHTILFLASNPLGMDRLALDEEARAMQVVLERSGHRDKFELVTRWAAQPLDLLEELRKLRPTVVHFGGHGGHIGTHESQSGQGPHRDIRGGPVTRDGDHQYGLFFQGRGGQAQLVSAAALDETFGTAGSSVRLVLLNACYSDVQAKTLLAHIDCIIGIDGSIRDDAARNFTVGFYGGLCEGESVAAAYRQGCAAMSLDSLPDAAKPKLVVRECVDVERLILTADIQPEQNKGERARGDPLKCRCESRAHFDRCALSIVASGPLPSRSHRFLIGIPIVICGLVMAWFTCERRTDSPPMLSEGLTTQATVAGPLDQPIATTNGSATDPVRPPTLTPREKQTATIWSRSAGVASTAPISSIPRKLLDCNEYYASSSMCSYRGTLRWPDGEPMSNIRVELVGTTCTALTNELGIFDFKTCDPNETRRLVNPSIFLHLKTDAHLRSLKHNGPHYHCDKIQLQFPPLVNEVRFDPATCDVSLSIPFAIPTKVLP